MPASDYIKSKIMGLVFGGVAYTPPGRYLALMTASGTEVSTSGTGYARASLPAFTLSGSSPTTAAVTSTVTFPVAAAAYGSSVTGWALYDASSGGNLLNSAPFADPRDVRTGDQFTVLPGGISVTLT